MTTAATSTGISGIRLVTAYLTTDNLAVSRNATIKDMTVSGTADFSQAQSVTGISTVAGGINLGSGAGLYRNATTASNTRTLNFRSIQSSSDVSVSQTAESIILGLNSARPFNNLNVTGSTTINTLQTGTLSLAANSSIDGTINVTGTIFGVNLSKFDVTIGGTKPGDLLVYNSSGKLVKLPVGTQGQVLSATNDTLGLSWVTPEVLPLQSVEDVIGVQPEGTIVYATSSAPNYTLAQPTTNNRGFLRYGATPNTWAWDTSSAEITLDPTSPVYFGGDIFFEDINSGFTLGSSGTYHDGGTNLTMPALNCGTLSPVEENSPHLALNTDDPVVTRDSVLRIQGVGFAAGGYCMNPNERAPGDYNDDWLRLSLTESTGKLGSTQITFVFMRCRFGSKHVSVTIPSVTVTPTSSGTGLTFNHGLISTDRFYPNPVVTGGYYSVLFTLEGYASGSTNPTFYTLSADATTIKLNGLPIVSGQPLTIPAITLFYYTDA